MLLAPWLLFAADGIWSQDMIDVTDGSGEAVWMYMARSKSERRQPLLEAVSASELSATTLKPLAAKSGIIRAWVSSRRLLPVLIIHRMVGTLPLGSAQRPSEPFFQPLSVSSFSAPAGS